jgi:hypothetical protein
MHDKTVKGGEVLSPEKLEFHLGDHSCIFSIPNNYNSDGPATIHCGLEIRMEPDEPQITYSPERTGRVWLALFDWGDQN